MNKKIIFIVLGVVISALLLFIFVGRGKIEEKNIKNSYSFLNVERGNVVQTVNVDGNVVATQEVDLRFQINGVIQAINYQVGDIIKRDDVLASLVANDQEIIINQRLANLAQARANLNLKLAGSSDEDIAIYQSKVDNAKKTVEVTKKSTVEDINNSKSRISLAEVALKDAIINLETVKKQNEVDLEIAYQRAQSVIDSSVLTIESTLDDINDILEDDDLDDLFSVKDIKYKTESVNKYIQARDSFEDILNQSRMIDDMSFMEIDSLLNQVKDSLSILCNLLDSVFNGLVSTVTSPAVSQTALESYKAIVNNLRIGINTAISNIESKGQSVLSIKTGADTKLSNANALINTTSATVDLENANLHSIISKTESQNIQAENSLQLARDELALKISGLRDVDVAYLQSKVSEALVSLDLARENLNKTNLLSPIDGVIVDIKFKVGESINSSNIFIRLTTNEKKIEADIPEIEVGKVHIGDGVEIILDAFTNKIFSGHIISIDPVETNIQGVVYYKTDIVFDDATSSLVVLPGMTADINILTEFKSGVLNLPGSSIKSDGSRFYIQTLQNDKIIFRDIEIGLMGNSRVEVVNGVVEGERVVDFILKTN